MKLRKLIFIAFTAIALTFISCDNSISDFLNNWAGFTPPEDASKDIQKIDVVENGEKDYKYIVLLDRDNFNENSLLRYNKIYISKEADAVAKGCFCTYSANATGAIQVLSLKNSNCDSDVDEDGFFTVDDSSFITFKVADEDVETVRNYGLVFKYKGLSVNKVYLVEEGSSGDNGEEGGGGNGDEQYTAQTEHMTLVKSERGVGIIVSVSDCYVQDSFMVIDKNTGTGFSIQPEFINSGENVEFIFPFCNPNQQMTFELHGNVKDSENASETRWINEVATVTSGGGVGPLNYTYFDRIKFIYSKSGGKGGYLSAENFTLDNINSLFANCNDMGKITDLYDEFGFISGYKDWTNGTFWLNGASNSFFDINESDTNLTYMLLSGKPIDILDSVGWYRECTASYINDELSRLKNLFFTFTVRFRIPEYNGQYIYDSSQNRTYYAGNFITKEIQSEEYTYTPVNLTKEDDQEGRAGENIRWQIKDDVLTFTGYGNLWGYNDSEMAPWQQYKYSSIVISEGITSIGSNDFSGNTKITSVTLPESLQSIGNNAFYDTEIYSVEIPASVWFIGENAFNNGTTLNVEWTKSDGNHNIVNASNYAINYKSEGGNISEDISWEIENGTLYITGQGAMSDYFDDDDDCPPWFGKTINKVVVESGITRIGDYAFYGCSDVNDIVIPDTVNSIGASAFSETGIKQILIPVSVTAIGNAAFLNCSSLETVYKPEKSNLGTISNNLFYNCSNLTNVIIVTEYEYNQVSEFMIKEYYLSESGTVNIPSSVKEIGYRSFYGSSKITDVIIPSSVETIGSEAFVGTDITKVTIPSTVISIAEDSFGEDCAVTYEGGNDSQNTGNSKYSFQDGQLTIYSDVNISADENFFEEKDFKASDVKKIIIEKDVKIISGAFHGCENLSVLDFSQNESLTEIGNNTFRECSKLSSVELPVSIQKIGDYAFIDCTSLTSVNFTECMNLETIGYCAFYGCGFTNIDLSNCSKITTLQGVFSLCKNLTGFSLPADIESLGYTAFACCYKLTDVDLSSYTNLKILGNNAFYRCNSLINVKLPESLSSIGDSAFYGCTSLDKVEIPSSVTYIGDNAFDSNTILYLGWTRNDAVDHTVPSANTTVYYEEIDWELTDGVLNIYANGEASMPDYGTSVSQQSPWYNDNSITKVFINEGVGNIGAYAFYNCKAIEYVYMADTVTSIGKYAFAASSLNAVTSLQSINLPSSLETIGEYAFQYCSGLETVRYSENSSLKTLSKGVFNYCSNLQQITIPASVETIGQYAFANCSSLETAYFEEDCKVTGFNGNTFADCSSLSYVGLPKGLTNLSSYTFKNCTSLTDLRLPSGVNGNIGTGCFSEWTSSQVVVAEWKSTENKVDSQYFGNARVFYSDTEKKTVNYFINNTRGDMNRGFYTYKNENDPLITPEEESGKVFLGWYTENTFQIQSKVEDLTFLFDATQTVTTEGESVVNLYGLWGEYYEVLPPDEQTYVQPANGNAKEKQTTVSFTETCQQKVYILPVDKGVTKFCKVYFGNSIVAVPSYCKPRVNLGYFIKDKNTFTVYWETSMAQSVDDYGTVATFDLALYTYENGDEELTAIVFTPEESGSTGDFVFYIQQVQ